MLKVTKIVVDCGKIRTMSEILLENANAKVHINYDNESEYKSAKTKIVVEFNYINSGNPFKNYADEFQYEEEVRKIMIKTLKEVESIRQIEI